MSWGISPNATEKEKIFADFNDCLHGMNCADGLSYYHYSKIYDIGRELADKEYEQGRADEREKNSGFWISFNKNGVRGCCEWWNRCDKCGHEQIDDTNYCPNCGANMKYQNS